MDVKYFLIANGLALLAFIVKDFWINRRKDIKENTQAISDNTKAIIELKVELKNIKEKTDEIPELRRDINSIGGKVRGLCQNETI